jgi:hypothetical protein
MPRYSRRLDNSAVTVWYSLAVSKSISRSGVDFFESGSDSAAGSAGSGPKIADFELAIAFVASIRLSSWRGCLALARLSASAASGNPSAEYSSWQLCSTGAFSFPGFVDFYSTCEPDRNPGRIPRANETLDCSFCN